MPSTEPIKEPVKARGRNVLGQPLEICGCEPMTGFYRTGCCETGPDDFGVHTICCIVNEEFLRVSKELGNDLSTPMPQFGFDGLNPGDRWCVCAARWLQVQQAGAGATRLCSKLRTRPRSPSCPSEVLIQYAVILTRFTSNCIQPDLNLACPRRANPTTFWASHASQEKPELPPLCPQTRFFDRRAPNVVNYYKFSNFCFLPDLPCRSHSLGTWPELLHQPLSSVAWSQFRREPTLPSKRLFAIASGAGFAVAVAIARSLKRRSR
jgi:uncharacterized protein (DUF2237 family)